jgi:hypothetical protein
MQPARFRSSFVQRIIDHKLQRALLGIALMRHHWWYFTVTIRCISTNLGLDQNNTCLALIDVVDSIYVQPDQRSNGCDMYLDVQKAMIYS